MNKKRAHIFTAEKPNMQLSRIISAITFIFERQNGYEVVDVIADYNSNGCISQEATQEIFDAIILKMTGISPKQDMNRFINMDELELINIGKNMFTYFLHDVVQSKFRKMLTIEQFKNKNLADQYIKQYFDYSLSYQQYIFFSYLNFYY